MMNDDIIMEKIDCEKLASEIRNHASESKNEEELKIRIETLLEPIRKKLSIQWASYEHRSTISGVRKDALYGTVIIEYKNPKTLDSKRDFEKGKEQIKKYITEEAVDAMYRGRYFGVLLDGYKISFIRFRKNEWEEPDEPLEVNARTVLRLLEAIRGLRRRPIDVELLLQDFGPKSETSKQAILVLYSALTNAKSSRTEMLYNDWKRVFSQVCAYSTDKLTGLIGYYGLTVRKDIDVEKFMFAVHTYYTILMKLLTSEIVALFTDSILYSYLKRLEEVYYKGKKEYLSELKDLENGGIFLQVGIKNLFEADYFAWYLDEANDEVVKSIFEIIKKLLDYEPATVELTPERVKDLFKRLYQHLVPREVRHKLGEYFTPDWLAELLLDEVGYYGNSDKRILDPACGSGTFLVLTIKRIKEYADKHFLDRRALLKKIVDNVQGIDLNPLAVLASKANYLIHIADLLRDRPKEGIEIPVYLADAIMVSRKMYVEGKFGVSLKTTIDDFILPSEIIDKKILPLVLLQIEACIKNNYKIKEFENIVKKSFSGLDETTVSLLVELYKKIATLERAGKNRIWVRLLKNSFAPLLMGKFDFVVGNPPWINWENLPEQYRENTKDLWGRYGLLEKTKGMGLGKIKRDMAMLFTVRCLDRYVKDGGKYSFLIPFTTYKTQAGAGFRKFLANGKVFDEKHKVPCKVTKIHDLVELYPFESAVNRTSMIIIEKEDKTKFPIQCTMWHNPSRKGIPVDLELKEVDKITKRFEMILTPVKKDKTETQWMTTNEKAYKAIEKVLGSSPWYKAHMGIKTALNAVYWVSIVSKEASGYLIENASLSGQKRAVKQIRQISDSDLIYPLNRGRELKRWFVDKISYCILIPHDSNSGKPLPETKMKIDYPKTYEYFISFKKELESRSIHKLWGKGNPFYSLYDIGNYTFYPYKVAWKTIAGGITGKAVSFASAVLEPIKNNRTTEKTKCVMPDNSLITLSFKNRDEAYYVSAVLNSSPVLFAIASYTYEIRMETHITKNIHIPKFGADNKLHLKLSNLSKKAHELAKQIYEEDREDLRTDLAEVEEEIDQTVAILYGLTNDELDEIKKTLRILKEGEVEDEEEKIEEETTLPAMKPIDIKVAPLFINGSGTIPINVSITNNFETNLNDVTLKVILESKKIELMEKEITDGIKVDVRLPATEIFSERLDMIKKGLSKTVEIITGKLRYGEYALKIILSYETRGITQRIEDCRTIYIKAEKTIQSESPIDRELDELLR